MRYTSISLEGHSRADKIEFAKEVNEQIANVLRKCPWLLNDTSYKNIGMCTSKILRGENVPAVFVGIEMLENFIARRKPNNSIVKSYLNR